MCGIAGIYRLGDEPLEESERAADRALVARMLRAMEYRGPDDEGIEGVGRVTFGARRLSILDVAGGHQPLANAEESVWAVQNGEIYNYPELRAELSARHPFRTRTDTELLPYLWQERRERSVEVLQGMFALAVYDARDGTLLLARDPLGVKPLYVAEGRGRVMFASELKALLCDPNLPRELDLDAVSSYLALGFIAGEATPFQAVRKLRPGTRMVVTPHGQRRDRYWPWPRFFHGGRDGEPIGSLADMAARHIADAVRAMLLSDRPLGVLLSGGLDSSVMTALLPADVRRETLTFAIGFEGGGHHDEREFARRVAAHLGTRHREFSASLDLPGEIERVVHFLDEPCADPAAVPAHLVARAASAEVTVLLSGTGGDEVFGGYHRYHLPRLLARARLLPRPLAAAAARALADRNENRRSAAAERLVMVRKLLEARSRKSAAEAYLSTLEPAPPERWRGALRVSADPARAGTALLESLAAELGRRPEDGEETAFAFDHGFYLPDDLLLKEDRTTMGASVEGRVPYLDDRLVRFAAGLPLASRFEGGRGKHLLRILGRRLLPREIAERRKHGFSVPIDEWLRGPLKPLAHDAFSREGSGLFHREPLTRWLDEHCAGRNRAGALWAALCWELWWRSIGAASPETIAAAGAPLASVRRVEPGEAGR